MSNTLHTNIREDIPCPCGKDYLRSTGMQDNLDDNGYLFRCPTCKHEEWRGGRPDMTETSSLWNGRNWIPTDTNK